MVECRLKDPKKRQVDNDLLRVFTCSFWGTRLKLTPDALLDLELLDFCHCLFAATKGSRGCVRLH